MINYVGKVGKIYATTLSLADTWTQVLTKDQAKGIQGFKIKSRMSFKANGAPSHPPRPFDYAFVASPASGDTDKSGDNQLLGNSFWSNGGGGSGDEIGTMASVYARSTVVDTVIEILVAE